MKELVRYLLIIASIGLYKLLTEFFELDQPWVLIYPCLLILLFGLPHGATDHLLDNFNKREKISAKITSSFLVSYLGVIVIYAVIWWISAPLALLLFLLMSAYHFGETQWMMASGVTLEGRLTHLQFFLWGVALLGLLFSIHAGQTGEYLKGLVDSELITLSQKALTSYIIPAALVTSILLSVFQYDGKVLLFQLIEFSLFIVLFYFTDLIYGFAVFFGLFHSKDAIELQLFSLRKLERQFGWIDFYRFAWPFTLISIVGIAGILILFYQMDHQINFITLFFIMISLVTAPHMMVIAQFYRK